MDKNTIIDYVMRTPGNTNKQVLSDMLDSVGGDSSLPEVTTDDNGKVLTVVEGVWNKGDVSGGGYSYTADETVLTNESVTTTDQGGFNFAPLSYEPRITADTITVIFDGIEYTCALIIETNSTAYGGYSSEGPDYTVYPFCILSSSSGNELYTSTEGTHSIEIKTVIEDVETSEGFDKAVEKTYKNNLAPFIVHISDNDVEGSFEGWEVEESFTEIWHAIQSGRLVYGRWNSEILTVTHYGDSSIDFQRISFGPSSGKVDTMIIAFVHIDSSNEVSGFYESHSIAEK